MHNPEVDPMDFSSVLQTERSPLHTSSSYNFISTQRVLEQLNDNGWHVVSGNQAKVKKPTKEGFQKHALKLENPSLNSLLPTVGKPQMLLRNAHEGSSSLNLLAAFHIFVCSNGAVSHSGDIGDIRILHRAFSEELMQAALAEFTKRIPKMVVQVEEWNSVKLTELDALDFSRKAIEMRFDPIKDAYGVDTSRYPVRAESALQSRRWGESPTTLWNAFNNLQENLIEKGGLRGSRNANGRLIPIRAVKGVDSNIKLNRQLWELAAATADQKLGRRQLSLALN